MARKIKCSERIVSRNLKNLFEVEIRNERFGGISPSTVSSALDSFQQAPKKVLRSWTKTRTNKDLGKVERELKRLDKVCRVTKIEKLI